MVCNACNCRADFTFDLYVHTCFKHIARKELHAPRRHILDGAGVPLFLGPGGIEYDLKMFLNAVDHTLASLLQPEFFNGLKRACAFTTGCILLWFSTVSMGRPTEGTRIPHHRFTLTVLVTRGRGWFRGLAGTRKSTVILVTFPGIGNNRIGLVYE